MTRCICSTAYVFRQLVKARLAYPVSKSATVEYLKNHFDEDVSLSKIYRYLDKLSDNQHEIVQGISVMHTSKIPDGHIGVLFYDVTTLYFEADYEDDLRKTGFSKEGRHKNPQIIPGLLVSIGGYPLAYCIYEGNKYEGHTMLPVVTEFVRKYSLDDFIVVADSGLMNGNNIADLESNGYKYIIGAKIKNESKKIQEWILAQPKVNCQMIEYDKGNGQRLLVGYTDDRARKDAYNREKGIRRLEKAYNRGTLTKDNINKRGYNKFLKMEGDVKVSINYDKLEADEKWDGLKGYLTNTDIPVSEVYAAYHNLWHVERAFRISKSKIEIRPMFHFTRRRIKAHVCICFVALKVYKELERLLKLSNINMSVDKVLALAQTIVTIQVTLPQSKQTITRTMLMKRHQRIAPLFNDGFWGTH
ncbi:MAG: IS1634 family transposase [Odoribacter splanchnicus]